jgi:Ion transport protein
MNFIFVGIFTAEFGIKLIGYGERYFKDRWNTFDMIIVILTLVSIVYGQSSSNNQLGPQTTVIRSFRIARIFFLFKRNRALKGTFQTFIGCIPAIANIGSLLLLIVMVYSILGVYLFAEVKFSGALTNEANFTTLGNAFLLLIRITTGEGWPQLMEAVSKGNDLRYDCIVGPTY